MKRVFLSLLEALVVFSALNLQPSSTHAQGTAFTFLTITNPTPAFRDEFGYAVAAVGTDHVLIGAHYDDIGAFADGAAYLFSINGVLLTTFTKPTLVAGGFFDSGSPISVSRQLQEWISVSQLFFS